MCARKMKQASRPEGSGKIKRKRKPKKRGPTKYTKQFIEAFAHKMEQWYCEDETKLFYIHYFSLNGLHRQRSLDWEARNEEFARVIEKCRVIQEQRLVDGALQDELNANMAQFYLKNKHGYKDRQEHDVAVGGLRIEVEKTYERK